jgi:hypothetical protein
MNKAKVVFIGSLERSGSTVLDLTLGRTGRCVSFGEVARVLEPHGRRGLAGVLERTCTCGASVPECQFWGPVLREIGPLEQSLSLSGRYAIFLARVRELYGPDTVAVDSSKYLVALDALRELTMPVDLRVLFLVRDVRGWVSSSRKAARRRKEIPYRTLFSREIRRHWRAYLRHNVLRSFPFWLPLEWYIRNRRIESHLHRSSVSYEGVSYEQLATETDATLRQILSFIGEPSAALSEGARSHLVRGNRMALEKVGPAIRYDSGWRDDRWSRYEAMVWPFVAQKNDEWVYGKKR